MSTKNDMMMDIEALGNKPNAAVVTIAAAFFDLATGEVGETFYRRISLESAMRFGRVDAGTLAWWFKQTSEAQSELIGNIAELGCVLTQLSEFYNKGNNARVWANGPTYDASILDWAYGRALGVEAPWPFYNVRCCRTITLLADGLASRPAPWTRKGVAHNALDDCLFQIDYCSKMYRALRPDLCKTLAPATNPGDNLGDI